MPYCYEKDESAYRSIGVSKLRDLSGLKNSELNVWAYLVSCSPDFVPTKELISKKTHLSVNTVGNAIQGLEQKRYAIVLKRRLESSTSVRRGGTFEYKYFSFDSPKTCLRWVRDEMAPDPKNWGAVSHYSLGWRFASPKNWEE